LKPFGRLKRFIDRGDDETVFSFCANETEQFRAPTQEEIFRQYSPSVFRLAYAAVANRADAEDLLQEVFVRYLEHTPHCRQEEDRRRWLMKVTVNLCRSHLRSAWQKTLPLTEEIPHSDPEPEEGTVLGAVLNLPPRYRTVIHLFYYEDLPIAAIASLTGTSEPGVRAQLTRARGMLKGFLKGEFSDV
jgi:RNA polymerase sigma-70 factor (ECF subfamily)